MEIFHPRCILCQHPLVCCLHPFFTLFVSSLLTENPSLTACNATSLAPALGAIAADLHAYTGRFGWNTKSAERDIERLPRRRYLVQRQLHDRFIVYKPFNRSAGYDLPCDLPFPLLYNRFHCWQHLDWVRDQLSYIHSCTSDNRCRSRRYFYWRDCFIGFSGSDQAPRSLCRLDQHNHHSRQQSWRGHQWSFRSFQVRMGERLGISASTR